MALPWQISDEKKEAQMPFLPPSLQSLPATSADHELRITAAEADIVALEAADTALDGRLDTAEADLAAATSAATPSTLVRRDGAGGASLGYLTMSGPVTFSASPAGAAGTAAAYMPSGPLLIAPEAGAIERLVDKLYFTLSTGVRKGVVLADSSLTSGRIPATTTDGRLYDSANFTRDPATGTVGITTASNSGLLITDTVGSGELAVKIRTSGATSGATQAGFDVGHSNAYRFTFATAGTGVSAPWGGSAYMWATGPTNGLRFINGDAFKPIEFWNTIAGVPTLAFRAYNGVLQAANAAITATSASSAVAAYFGKTGNKQLRIGDMSGYCWTFGRNSSTGDLELSSTKNDGTDYVTNALTIGGGSGVVKAAFGLEVTDLTPGQPVYATTSGRLTSSAPYAAKTANYTLTAADRTIRADATGGSFTLTLPTAVGHNREYYIKCISAANVLTVATTSSQTIDGVTSLTLAQHDCLHVQSDGANWMVL